MARLSECKAYFGTPGTQNKNELQGKNGERRTGITSSKVNGSGNPLSLAAKAPKPSI